MYQNSSKIGNIGEAVAISEFIKLGFNVSIPFGDNCPYDLIVDYYGKLLKIQCKTCERIHGSVMEFSINRTNGFTGKHTPYSDNEIDYFFLYCVENGYMCLIPVDKMKATTQFTIRITKINNYKNLNINYANDMIFPNHELQILKPAIIFTDPFYLS